VTEPMITILAAYCEEYSLRCERCQKVEVVPLPMPANAIRLWAEYVSELHRHCPEGEMNEKPTRDEAKRILLRIIQTGRLRILSGQEIDELLAELGFPEDKDA